MLLHLVSIVNISQTYWCVYQILENFMDTEQPVFICSVYDSVFWILVTRLKSLYSSV